VRIAIVALHFAEYASRLALALAAKHDVLLLLRPSNAQRELTAELRSMLEASVRVRLIEPRRRRDPRVLGTSFAMNRLIRPFAPDVLHVQELHPLLGGWTTLSFRKRIPVVLTVHDPVNHSGDGPAPDRLRWQILMWFRRRTSRLIVHGPQMRAALEALDASMAERIDVIPHGLLGTASVDEAPSAGPPTFLFFGRIEPYKGLDYFLRAGELLQERGHAPKLVVAGAGTDLERHRRRIAASPWVELIDRYVMPAEVSRLFGRATAVVLPYTDATQSGVAAIALGNSRPVIASAVGDVPDVVIHGRTGVLVPPADAVALADAMEQLVVDGTLRSSLATGAGQHARERLSWPRIAELTEGTYRRAIDARSFCGTPRLSAADRSK
jgi:glycosyltransferase involved in cell wall biosynthesis